MSNNGVDEILTETAIPSATGAYPTRKAIQTQRKLIAAGIELFSSQGYDATSTREVESRAGVQRNLITYHFASKDEFWKRCMTALFARSAVSLDQALEQSDDIEPDERIRFLIRQYLRASAASPEIVRIMFDEGRRDEWRLDWLVENHVRGFYETVRQIFEAGRERGVVPDVSDIQFYYLLVSSAAIFAMAPECRRLSGVDPNAAEMIDAQANAIALLLTTPTHNKRESP